MSVLYILAVLCEPERRLAEAACAMLHTCMCFTEAMFSVDGALSFRCRFRNTHVFTVLVVWLRRRHLKYIALAYTQLFVNVTVVVFTEVAIQMSLSIVSLQLHHSGFWVYTPYSNAYWSLRSTFSKSVIWAPPIVLCTCYTCWLNGRVLPSNIGDWNHPVTDRHY